MNRQTQQATLLLANGMTFTGWSVGAKGSVIGEVVFTTGMTGYIETLTDPTCYGQIVTQTFPLIGNYGVNTADFESKRCWLSGYIVREWCEAPSNFRSEMTLEAFLEAQNVVGIWGIDTRALTKVIREEGVMPGMITTEPIEDKEAALAKLKAFAITEAVKTVSNPQTETFEAEGEALYHAAMLDLGYKKSMLQNLCRIGCKVTVLPYDASASQIKALAPDGIMLSGGPADPHDNPQVIQTVQELMEGDIPLFGIGLGHQIMALASGAKVEKLPYGHRGANQPVIDLAQNRTFVTVQNHGYVVQKDSLDETKATVSHVNANDATVEGIRYAEKPFFGVQFHPEACQSPQKMSYLYAQFVQYMHDRRKA